MNITPEFRTSMEWKKYRAALKHPAAMELFVNLGCELEGITRKTKSDTGHLGINSPDDLALMAGAEVFPEIEAARLVDSLLSSGLMTKDEEGYRLTSWEVQNANLLSSRRNGKKGGRKKNSTEGNQTEGTESNQTEGNLTESNQTKETESNKTEGNTTERKVTERNVTGGLTQREPQVKSGFSGTEKYKAISRSARETLEKVEAEERRIFTSKLGGGKISNSAEELKKEIQMLKDG
jgi:hypothetical protein